MKERTNPPTENVFNDIVVTAHLPAELCVITASKQRNSFCNVKHLKFHKQYGLKKQKKITFQLPHHDLGLNEPSDFY